MKKYFYHTVINIAPDKKLVYCYHIINGEIKVLFDTTIDEAIDSQAVVMEYLKDKGITDYKLREI